MTLKNISSQAYFHSLCSVCQRSRLLLGRTLVTMATRCRFFYHTGVFAWLHRKPDLSPWHFVSVSSFWKNSLVYTDSLSNTGRLETRDPTSTHLHSPVLRNPYHTLSTLIELGLIPLTVYSYKCDLVPLLQRYSANSDLKPVIAVNASTDYHTEHF